MLIRITGRAEVTLDDDAPVTALSMIQNLDGVESDDVCGNYLDSDLADLGIAGGRVKLAYNADERDFQVATAYSSLQLKPAQLERLARDTQGQWSDGIDEGCFDDLAAQLGVTIDLSPLGQDKDLRVEQIEDGKTTGKPMTALAKAAREGDMPALKKNLDAGADVDTRLQGYTPLHWAVIYGQAEAALELIERGANINARDVLGQDALMLTALSNSMTDAEAARIAKVLLEHGVCVHGPKGPSASPSCGEYTPLYLANDRQKTDLAAVLKEFGASQ